MTRLLALRPRLLFLVLLAVLPALGLVLYTGMEQRSAASAAARLEVQRWSRMVVHRQEDEIQAARQILATLSQVDDVREEKTATCNSLFAGILRSHPQIASLLAIRPSGQVFCSTLHVKSAPVFPDQAEIQRALQSQDLTIGKYALDPGTDMAVLSLSYPVFGHDGQPQSILFATLQLTWLDDFASSLGLPPGSMVVVFDQTGKILARYPNAQEWVGKLMPEQALVQTVSTQNQEGTAQAIGPDQVSRLYAFAPLGDKIHLGCSVAVGIPVIAISAVADDSLVRNLILLGSAAIFALLVAWVFGDVFIVRRVNLILAATQRLARGDLSARTGIRRPIGELSQLAYAFDRMADSLQERDKELREAESRYRTLVEQAPAITYIARLNPASSALYISPQIQSLGFSPEEWIADPERWVKQIHSDDRVRVLEHLARTHANQEPFQVEYRIISRDGEVHWFRDQAALVRGSAGEPLYFEGILLDITDRKRAEEEIRNLNANLEQRVQDRTQELLVVNQELEAFSYSVSHDLRTPVASAQNLARLILETYGSQIPADCLRSLKLIDENMKMMDRLITDLLDLARTTRQPLVKQTVIPTDLVKQLVEELRSLYEGRKVEFVIDEMPRCEADPGLARQVFVNLLSNAIKFTRAREVARIEVGYGPANGERAYFVKDNGVGFDEQSADRLFGAFQRLHSEDEYEGSGIGLAIVARIIHRHGGRIWAEGQVEQGATFYFVL